VPDLTALVALLSILAIVAVAILLGYMVIVGFGWVLHRYKPALSAPRDPALDVLRTRLANCEFDETGRNRLRSVLLSR
jgi:uncharacterized membrane protein